MEKICCKCGKVLCSDGTWRVDPSVDSSISTHGYCPECARIELAEIRLYYDGKRKLNKDDKTGIKKILIELPQ